MLISHHCIILTKTLQIPFLVWLFFQRWGLDRKGRLAIESYIRGNNLALDVSSVLDGFVSSFLISLYCHNFSLIGCSRWVCISFADILILSHLQFDWWLTGLGTGWTALYRISPPASPSSLLGSTQYSTKLAWSFEHSLDTRTKPILRPVQESFLYNLTLPQIRLLFVQI